VQGREYIEELAPAQRRPVGNVLRGAPTSEASVAHDAPEKAYLLGPDAGEAIARQHVRDVDEEREDLRPGAQIADDAPRRGVDSLEHQQIVRFKVELRPPLWLALAGHEVEPRHTHRAAR